MDKALYGAIHKGFVSKTSAELRGILGARDSGEWSEEAVAAAEDILASRPAEPEEETGRGAAQDGATPAGSPSLGVFAASPGEIRRHRIKVQAIGWMFCAVAAVIGLPAGSMLFYELRHLASFTVVSVVLKASGLAVAFMFGLHGSGLVKLDPGARKPGMVMAACLLFSIFLQNGIGLAGFGCGVLGLVWLWKWGRVIDQTPQVPPPPPTPPPVQRDSVS